MSFGHLQKYLSSLFNDKIFDQSRISDFDGIFIFDFNDSVAHLYFFCDDISDSVLDSFLEVESFLNNTVSFDFDLSLRLRRGRRIEEMISESWVKVYPNA